MEQTNKQTNNAVAKLGSIFLQTLIKQHAIDQLKEALVSILALVTINYIDSGTIIVAVDASGLGQEAVLMQVEKDSNRYKHPVRFESGLWTKEEAKYDAGCCGANGARHSLQYSIVLVLGGVQQSDSSFF